MFLVGIGEVFTYKRRKWNIIDIRDGSYICETVDDNKKVINNFTKNEMYKIFGGV